jgi:hypothetical protein
MPGSYPRTENDKITDHMCPVEELDKTLRDLSKSVDYFNAVQWRFKLVRGKFERYRVCDQNLLKNLKNKPKEILIDVNRYGKQNLLDVDKIERNHKYSKNPSGVDYLLTAKLEINNPSNNLPNFVGFSKQEDIIKMETAQQLEKYFD